MSGLLKSVLPAVIPQMLYLVALGELMWEFDPAFVEDFCLPREEGSEVKGPLVASIIRCEAMRDYSGPAKDSAGTIMLAALALCTCVSSASYVYRIESIRTEPPWKQNHLWLGTLISSFVLIAIYMSLVLEDGSMTALPWYFYLLFLGSPCICLFICEHVKKIDKKQEKRAVMMRRLQFETRLGMWSPKESTHMEAIQRREQISP